MAIALGLLVLAATVAAIAYTAWFLRRGEDGAMSALAAERAALRARLNALAASLADGAHQGHQDRPAMPGDLAAAEARVAAAPGDLATAEARVAAAPGDLAAAEAPVAAAPGDLAAAEARVAAAPGDGKARALLARALLARGDLDAAAAQAAQACALGGGALALLVQGQAAYAAGARDAGLDRPDASALARPASPALDRPGAPALVRAGSPALDRPGAPEPLLSPGELALLQRELARRAAGEPMPEHIAAHFRRGQEALGSVLAAAEDAGDDEATRAEAVHQAARVAIKLGLIREGRALLERLEPRAGDPAASRVRRDLDQLRNDDLAGELTAPPAVGARRSPRLRILS